MATYNCGYRPFCRYSTNLGSFVKINFYNYLHKKFIYYLPLMKFYAKIQKKAADHLPPGTVRLLVLVVMFFWSAQILGAGKLTRQLRRFMDQDR
jgi:hypothetical protein